VNDDEHAETCKVVIYCDLWFTIMVVIYCEKLGYA